jgi:hypothetical protein
LEDARIDTAEFRHDWLLDLMDLLSPVCFGKTPIRGRIPVAGARAKPATPGRHALARRTLAAAAGDAAPAFASILQNRPERLFIGSALAIRTLDARPNLIREPFGAGRGEPSYCARSRQQCTFRALDVGLWRLTARKELADLLADGSSA